MTDPEPNNQRDGKMSNPINHPGGRHFDKEPSPSASPPSLDAPAEITKLKAAMVRLRDRIEEEGPHSSLVLVRIADVRRTVDEIDRLMLVNGQIAKLWADSEDRATTRQMNAEDLGPGSYGITATGCEP